MSKKSLKKHMSFADNEELVKTIMSLAESEQTNAIPLSDRVRPDIRNNIPRQISSENIAELLDYSPNTTPIPLSDRVRPDIRNNIPRQISSENIAELLDYSPNTTPIPLSDRVRPDIIEANSESQKSCNSAIDDDWEEVVINVAADERHFNAGNNPPGGSSEAAIGLVKSSQSKENSCPDLFLEKGTQSDTAQDGDLLLQDNSFKKPDNSNNSSKLLPSTHLPSNSMVNRKAVVCDVAPQTAPIIRREKGSNIALEIALDFTQKHHLVLSDKMLWAYNGQYYVPLTESDAQRFIFSEYRDDVSRGNTMSLIKNIVSLLKVTVIDTVEVFPANEHIIVFRNGTLEVANDNFRENSPRDLASSALSIDYDPSQKEMPVTNKFLNTITNGDSVLYKRLLQVIGYILSNEAFC